MKLENILFFYWMMYLSELDDHRQSHLLNTIQDKVQTFVTTTSVEGIDHRTLKEAATFFVKNGTLEQVQ